MIEPELANCRLPLPSFPWPGLKGEPAAAPAEAPAAAAAEAPAEAAAEAARSDGDESAGRSAEGDAGLAGEHPSSFAVGDRVFANKTKQRGTVRHVGEVRFAKGDWVGLEMDLAVGKHDGDVQGRMYFRCAPKHGVFVRPVALTKLVERPQSASTSLTTQSSSSFGARQSNSLRPAKHKYSYFTYNKLVGDADGGVELPPEQFAALLEAYHQSWEDRLAVTWRNGAGKDCVRVKPSCWCTCGHTFKSHAWYDADEKRLGCRCPGCACGTFAYLPRQGSWILTCTCRHPATEHAATGTLKKCERQNCTCEQFLSKHVCMCGEAWDAHSTTFEKASERRAHGRPVDADVVAERLALMKREKRPGCGRCMGCKAKMPCRDGHKYLLTGEAL